MRGVAIMMFLRVYALYNRQKIVLGVVIFLFLFQVCMNGWLLTRGEGAFGYSAIIPLLTLACQYSCGTQQRIRRSR